MGELEKVACSLVFERVYNQGIDQVGNNYDKQLAELRPGIYEEFSIPSDHPACSTVAPEVELVDPPQPYSTLVLPDFNEEEYLKELADEDLEKSPEIVNNLSQDAAEANTAAKGALNADVSPAM